MLSETKLSFLQQFIETSTKEELIYAKGFIDGYFVKFQPNGNPIPINGNNVESKISVKPLIVYGTETGNSKKLATQILGNLKKEKIQAKTQDIAQLTVDKLKKEEHILFIISTQGEGELPETAVRFYEELKSSSEDFSKLNYSVFGLGDSSYPLFCSAGILLDEALAEKKAKRILPLVKADVDYKNSAVEWENNIKNIFKNSTLSEMEKPSLTVDVSHQKKYYEGVIANKIILNDQGSNKETYHIEIVSENEVIYQPGDALGILPKNRKEEVDFLLKYFKTKGSDLITVKNEEKSAEHWLQTLNIKGLGKKSLLEISKLFDVEINTEKADLADVLPQKNKGKVTIVQVLEILLPIAPRLYSISSSKDYHDGQVHLTVNLNKFSVNEVEKTGLASQFLAELPLEEKIEFYIHPNPNFKLPQDDKDIILIGPGTGIAPFRSFIAERDSRAAEGKNWLFFGEQHFVLDFYYQTEIQEWISTGVISKLSTAFSRDQEKKIYVQDRIKENAKEFVEWLDNGAYLYICGQKNPMSRDVENTIIEILSSEKNITREQAAEYLENLETAERFQKDVY